MKLMFVVCYLVSCVLVSCEMLRLLMCSLLLFGWLMLVMRFSSVFLLEFDGFISVMKLFLLMLSVMLVSIGMIWLLCWYDFVMWLSLMRGGGVLFMCVIFL